MCAFIYVTVYITCLIYQMLVNHFAILLVLIVFSRSRKIHDNHVFPMNKTLLSWFLPWAWKHCLLRTRDSTPWSVGTSVGNKYLWITSGIYITAPAQPSATELPCLCRHWPHLVSEIFSLSMIKQLPKRSEQCVPNFYQIWMTFTP